VNRRTAFLALVLFGLVGCQYDPWANGFLTGQPIERDVAGTYVISAESLKRTIKLPLNKGILPVSSSAKIVLSTDHKAEFAYVPEDYRGDSACSVSGHGSWKIERNNGFYLVRAIITNEEPNSLCGGEFGYEVMLYGRKPPYRLHITIGDPDSGDAVQFEKQ
jgi:hypothetical protein